MARHLRLQFRLQYRVIVSFGVQYRAQSKDEYRRIGQASRRSITFLSWIAFYGLLSASVMFLANRPVSQKRSWCNIWHRQRQKHRIPTPNYCQFNQDSLSRSPQELLARLHHLGYYRMKPLVHHVLARLIGQPATTLSNSVPALATIRVVCNVLWCALERRSVS